jgi:hypothetical protein
VFAVLVPAASRWRQRISRPQVAQSGVFGIYNLFINPTPFVRMRLCNTFRGLTYVVNGEQYFIVTGASKSCSHGCTCYALSGDD